MHFSFFHQVCKVADQTKPVLIGPRQSPQHRILCLHQFNQSFPGNIALLYFFFFFFFFFFFYIFKKWGKWKEFDLILNIAILPSLNHLKSAIRRIQIWCIQGTKEAYPNNITNLTGVYKIACNRCVRVDRSALAFGLGVGGWGRGQGRGVVLLSIYVIQYISVSRY